MLDDILEIIFELFLEILAELFPKVPRPIRIFLTCLLLIGLFGEMLICIACLYTGI